jgi:signal transduction histidine kinase
MKAQMSKETEQLLAALERRNTHLQTAAEVSRATSGLLDPDELIRRVVDLVHDRFGLYYTGLFLVDQTGEWGRDQNGQPEPRRWAVLRAGTGEAGHKMLEKRHKLEVGDTSMIGWCIAHKQARIAANVDEDTVRFDNPFLPETRSELALPLISRGEVIGAMSIQSNEASNEELDAFAHTVAHDLREPLSLIILGIAILLDDSSKTLDDDVQERLDLISRAARRMRNIIRELLLLASVRKAEIEITPLEDMADIVTEAQQRLDYMIEEYEAEIILPETWPVALGYGPWIEEVWANYISNAIKYGGQPPRIELGADSQESGMIRFWIHDNGLGLTPEERSRLFAPFTRLGQVRAKGYGLGLSIVQRIVRKLGGQVEVESKIGQGSTFSFTLPKSRPWPSSTRRIHPQNTR